jgi:murein L,D-transpeptidase YcbB/YkuD
MTSALLLAGLLVAGVAQRPETADERVAERIRTRVEVAGVETRLVAGGDRVLEPALLTVFYGRRGFRPAWSDEHGPNRLADDLIEAVRRADLDGLRPEDYHLEAILGLLGEVRSDASGGHLTDPDRSAELDLLLTDAFLMYGSHLLQGRVDPETLHPRWNVNRRGADLAALLEDALDSRSVPRTLQRLAPTHEGYVRLRAALAHARSLQLNGGWEPLPDGPALKRGDHGAGVAALRDRLRRGGDLEGEGSDSVFDERLERAVQRFQRRHGLDADGVVSTGTRGELNVSAVRRVRQLELNLERWRWLPKELGRRRIMVNIAAYELQVIEDEEVVLPMRVVVGRRYRRTPVFSDTVRYIVLNPNWYVPRTITTQDLLPKIQNDPSYVQRYQMHVVDDAGTEIDPATIDWASQNPDSFPYRLTQEPGPLNALGRIKFMFPNRYDVYLHDTPSRDLFEETRRDFSSGCIRVEKPLELAEYLLRKNSGWKRDALEEALDTGAERTVHLKRKIPIHLLYWTAWADEDGTINFRPDIHDLDPPLAAALNRH